jgi:hypothetical protein
LPDHGWSNLEAKYGKLHKTPAIDEWLEDRQERYSYIGDWLAHWQLDMSEPKGEKASLYSSSATACHRFVELCYGLVRLSPALQHFSGEAGSIRLASNALLGDFFRDMADSGVGRALGLPHYPKALVEGKDDEYQRSVRELRSLGFKPGNHSAKPKRGRPKGSMIRSYPKECMAFTEVILEAQKIASRNTEFQRKLYNPWLNAKSQANTFCQSHPEFKVGIVAAGRPLLLSGKGTKLKGI